MACLWRNEHDTHINIPTTEELTNITYYVIVAKVGEIQWKVKHRYKEFFNLHNQLVADHGVSKDILPSKKIIGNKSDEFIETRRKALEDYLQKVFVFLKRTMPKVFVEFLDFHLYDIYFLLQELSVKCFTELDFILSTNKSYSLTPLALYAISESLKNPFPDPENLESRLDLGPILDLCSQLDSLYIIGSSQQYVESNIVLNKLPFELSALKIHTTLKFKNVALDMVYSLGTLRDTLTVLKACHTNANSVCDVIQCDVLHKKSLEGSQTWAALKMLDLSDNNITEIDKTIGLAENLKTLILDNNKISTISNLTHLPKLEKLSLSNNLITICDETHTKVGNIRHLILSENSIVTTKGFCKMYSLETFDLSCNKIDEIEELKYLGNLPCLENLALTGNNVSTIVDYRIRVLEIFGESAKDVCLDNEKPSQAELDKVSVLSALRIVKEGKMPNL